MSYLVYLGILVMIYSIATMGLNLMVGYAGLVSLAHAAFYGVGAYVTALVMLHLSNDFFLNLLLVIAVSAVIGAIISIPSLRTKEDYFILTTFGFQVIVYSIFNNWISVTKGPFGIVGIPEPQLFGIAISNLSYFFALTAALAISGFVFLNRLVNSPFGRVVQAIREDELFAQSLGKDASRYKVIVFIVGAVLAGVAGQLYAYFITVVHPSSFTVWESIFMLSIVIIGGAGSLWGPVLGTVLLILFPEFLRFIGMPDPIAANLRQIIYGLLLVLFMMFRPSGLIGKYGFERR